MWRRLRRAPIWTQSGAETDISFDEASEIASDGHDFLLVSTLSGMLVMQQLDTSCTLSSTDAEYTITVSATGAVMAVNDAVTVGAGA